MGCARVTKNCVAKLFWQFMGVTDATGSAVRPVTLIFCGNTVLQRITVSNVRVKLLVLQGGTVAVTKGGSIGGMIVRHWASQPPQVTLASDVNFIVKQPLFANMVGGAVLPLKVPNRGALVLGPL